MSTYKWLRLWHDMPNDPKWRTISRASKQPIALVQAIYIHLLVDASQNVTKCHDVSQRGHVTVTIEDLASALDVENEQIEAVLNAMQGRVLDGSKITGWESRQPKKEDLGNAETGAKSAAQRKREQRERERIQREEEQNKNAGHEDVTKCHGESQQDKDKIRDIKPLSNTREDNFQSNPNANNSILNGRVPAGGFGVNDKFVMYQGWEPDQDFTQKAAYWGTILKEPLQPHELAEFVTFWKSEGKAKTHEQWEMALAKSIKYQRSKNGEVKNGASNRVSSQKEFSGHSRSMQEFYRSVREEYGDEAIAAMEEADRALWGQMDQQERSETVIDVEASTKRIE
ncbi:DnaT-like ssDNA-binding domain-containing protein [Providencia vermicola]|uniref:DnaT-like ssDNA-binding domain-containing protein n=1 Tax=Providencia vermicola TaxID=333965 RepID=UPI0032D9B464